MIALLSYTSLTFFLLAFAMTALDRWSMKRIVKGTPGAKAPRRYKQQNQKKNGGDKEKSQPPQGNGDMVKWLFDERTRQGFGIIVGGHMILGFIGGGITGVISVLGFWVLLFLVPMVFEHSYRALGTDTNISRLGARFFGIAGACFAPVLHFLIWPWPSF